MPLGTVALVASVVPVNDEATAGLMQRLHRGLRDGRSMAGALQAGDILLLHDGGCARSADGKPVVLAVLPLLLERMTAAGLTSVPLPAALGDGPAG